MPAYVRVRKHEDLVAAVDLTGTQTDVAALAGISLSRLSQLYTGRHNTIEVSKAAALEDTLGVPRGHLFKFVESYEQLAPYVDHTGRGPEPTRPDQRPAPQVTRRPWQLDEADEAELPDEADQIPDNTRLDAPVSRAA